MQFIIYDMGTGQIDKNINCSAHDLILNVMEGQSAILGWASDITQMVINGEIVDKPPVIAVPPPYNLQSAQATQSTIIRKACEQSIITGFNSTALGDAYLYPSNDRDQVNLSGTIQKSLLPSAQPTDYYPFLCADINGAWEYRPHTAAQIQQVGVDAYNAILQARVKNATLQYQITQATNQEELDAIVW